MRWMFRMLAGIGLPVDDRHAGAGGAPLQVGALPFAFDAGGGVRVLLVTARRSGRWIVPKGWPVRGLTLAESAAKEAGEEAGVSGVIGGVIGRIDADRAVPGSAPSLLIHALHVDKEHADWPERKQRRRRWLTREEAAEQVASPALAAMVLRFDPACGSPTR